MSFRTAPALTAAALAACLGSPALAAGPSAAGPADDTAIAAPDAPLSAKAPIDPVQVTSAGEATPAFTVSGSATLISDYRFRGVSQSDEDLAVEGGITIAHKSGFYVATWGSNLAGWGTFGGANIELDLIGGFKTSVGQGTLDTGLTWYMYPGGADTSDFAELYARLSGDIGPVSLTAGVAYAPPQEALGNVYANAARFALGLPNRPGDKEHNLYLSGDAVYGVAGTPVSLKAHVGYTDGNPGLGPNGTSVAPTGSYADWMIGADVTPIEHLTLSVAYIDTDIGRAESAYLFPNFATLKGKPIADATVVFSITAAF